MNYSAIPTSVRYLSDGTTCAWPITFPYGSPTGVACKVMDMEGKERLLTYGADYTIKDNCVMTFVPAGCSIMLWMTEPVETALAGAGRKAMTQNDIATTSNGVPSESAAAVSSAAASGQSAEIASLAAQLREMKALQENALVQARLAEEDRQVQRIEDAGDKAAASLGAAIANEATEAQQKLVAQRDASVAEIRSATTNAVDEAEAARQKALEAQQAASEALAKLEAARAAFDKAVAEAQETLGNAEENARDSLAMLASQASMSLAAAEEETAARIRHDCELHHGCINQDGHFTQTVVWKSGSIIPLPEGIKYYPGRNMLRVTHNGRTLVLNVDYQEVANADDNRGPSGEIKILFDSAVNSLWSFWVVAANAGRRAIDAAADAEHARRRSEEWAARSRDYANQADAIRNGAADDAALAQKTLEATGQEYAAALTTIRRDTWKAGQKAEHNIRMGRYAALTEIGNNKNAAMAEIDEARRVVDCWRQASSKSARASHEMAQCAWDAAWQASMQSRRPGIASVRKFRDLFKCASGVYVINPHIAHSPTIFMGIWPVQKFGDIQYDGIFFVGPQYPDKPNPPPKPKPRPKPQCPCQRPEPDPANPKDGPVEWGPCEHHNYCNVTCKRS